jgi:glyoxylase-like metal-dependent hydrolase (beta-lactamase superfamily II)
VVGSGAIWRRSHPGPDIIEQAPVPCRFEMPSTRPGVDLIEAASRKRTQVEWTLGDARLSDSYRERPQAKEPTVAYRIDRIEGRVMPVNAYVVHGPSGLVLIDGMLTVSDAALVREAIDESDRSLAGVVVTHPHPDHYAGLAEITNGRDVAIIATRAVDEVIRRDDETKNDVVGPMMGTEWPTRRLFPNQTVANGDHIELGGLTLTVEELGPGESPLDCLWRLDPPTVFAGDIAYNRMHAYLADGHWQAWLATLDRLDTTLPPDVTLHVGHGPPGGKELLAAQRHYIETFITTVTQNADAIAAGDHTAVAATMRTLLPTDELLFLMDLSIEPVLAAWQTTRPA